MRILVLTPAAGDRFGQERLVRDSSLLLRSVGHEVFVITDDFNGDSTDYDGVVTISGASVVNRFTHPRIADQTHTSILNCVKNINPDIIYFVDQFDSEVGQRLIDSYPVIVSVHTVAATCPSSTRLIRGDRICGKKGGWGCLAYNLHYGCLDFYGTAMHQYVAVERFMRLRETYKKAHHFIAVSRYIRDTLIWNGWDEKKISIIYNPVDPKLPDSVLELPKNLLVCASRLNQIKGIDRLILALSPLKDEDFVLWICGDGKEERNLRELVEMVGLQRKVVFKGKVSYSEMVNVMRGSLAVIQPNVGAEAFGLSAAEASSLGVPVIAADVPALNEILIPNKNALFFNPHRNEELTDCIRRVLKGDATVEALKKEGPKLIKERFGPKKHLRDLIVAFEKTIETFHRRPSQIKESAA